MKLIMGLGNPGAEYKASRHNIGFSLVDLLAQRWSVDIRREKHDALFGQGSYHGEKALLMKPITYMNRSGKSALQAVKFYKIEQSDFMVVFDDMDLDLGQLRLRSQGSAGGHNGLQDIIDRLGTHEFARLRIGIGSAGPGRAVSHVLGKFADEEADAITPALEQAANAVECWIANGIDTAMNRFNTQRKPKNEDNER